MLNQISHRQILPTVGSPERRTAFVIGIFCFCLYSLRPLGAGCSNHQTSIKTATNIQRNHKGMKMKARWQSVWSSVFSGCGYGTG